MITSFLYKIKEKEMFCRDCGTQLKDGAVFCSNCGARVMPAEEGNRSIPVPPVKQRSHEGGRYEQNSDSSKPLQIPIIIAAVSIVIVVGCLIVLLVMQSREPDEHVADQEVISRKEVSREVERDQDISDSIDGWQDFFTGSGEDEESGQQEIQAVHEPTAEASQYILPNSDCAYLSHADLVGMTKEDCRLARNELYARHGRKFDDEELQNYFNSREWYRGNIDPADFNDSVLNDFEIANRDLIVQYEEEMGYR